MKSLEILKQANAFSELGGKALGAAKGLFGKAAPVAGAVVPELAAAGKAAVKPLGPIAGLATSAAGQLIPRWGKTLTNLGDTVRGAGNAAVDAGKLYSPTAVAAKGIRGVGRFAMNHPLATAGGAAYGAHAYTRNKAEDAAAQAYEQFTNMPWYQRLAVGWNPELAMQKLPPVLQQKILNNRQGR